MHRLALNAAGLIDRRLGQLQRFLLFLTQERSAAGQGQNDVDIVAIGRVGSALQSQGRNTGQRQCNCSSIKSFAHAVLPLSLPGVRLIELTCLAGILPDRLPSHSESSRLAAALSVPMSAPAQRLISPAAKRTYPSFGRRRSFLSPPAISAGCAGLGLRIRSDRLLP